MNTDLSWPRSGGTLAQAIPSSLELSALTSCSVDVHCCRLEHRRLKAPPYAITQCYQGILSSGHAAVWECCRLLGSTNVVYIVNVAAHTSSGLHTTQGREKLEE